MGGEGEQLYSLPHSAVICDVRVWGVNQYQAHSVIEGIRD